MHYFVICNNTWEVKCKYELCECVENHLYEVDLIWQLIKNSRRIPKCISMERIYEDLFELLLLYNIIYGVCNIYI